MIVSPCPNCGGSDQYLSRKNTPANGVFGPRLLPTASPGRFRIVVCKDCGLTRLFASIVDTQGLKSRDWERVSEQPTRPLGIMEK
jgi:predicted nucleic-acid-binding Zn-ribbon protein